MKNITDLNLVRQYLLGRLDEQADLEDNVSDGILFNDEMTDIVDSIEDEIIEEYMEGSLDSVDREAVDKYFLQPPERVRGVCSISVLHLGTSAPAVYGLECPNIRPPPSCSRSASHCSQLSLTQPTSISTACR